MARFLWSVVWVSLVTILWLMTSVPAAPTRATQNRDNFSSDVNTTESLLTSAGAVKHDSWNETGETNTAVDDDGSVLVTTQSKVVSSTSVNTNSSNVRNVTPLYEPTPPSRRNATLLSVSKHQVVTNANDSSPDERASHSNNYAWSEIYAKAFGRDKDKTYESARNSPQKQSQSVANSLNSSNNATLSYDTDAAVFLNRSGDNSNISEVSSVTQETISVPAKQPSQKISSSDNSTTAANTTEETIAMKADEGGLDSQRVDPRESTVQEETELNLRVLEAAKNVTNNVTLHQESSLSDVISPLGDVTGPVNVTAATTSSDNSTGLTPANVTTGRSVPGVPRTDHLGILVKHLTGFVHNVWVSQPSSKTPGPSNEDLMDDGPFGSVLMREQKYLISVLIPIGVGITGAMLIIIMAYATRMCGRRDQQEDSQPRMIYNPGMRRRSPDRFPLQESSDEEF